MVPVSFPEIRVGRQGVLFNLVKTQHRKWPQNQKMWLFLVVFLSKDHFHVEGRVKILGKVGKPEPLI